MPWQCATGECLLIPSGPGDKSHLFTVVLGPKRFEGHGESEQVVMVSVTTIKPDFPYDPACVIRAGEHPFIEHDSYVYYREPRVESVSHVASMVETMGWLPKESCSAELRRRIVEGLLASKRVPRHVKLLLED